ncbi:MAG: PLP-dependent aminotransferase family protein [Woeseiaceae bacterium]
MIPRKEHRYQELASELANAMRAGTLRVGDRVPSVRKLSAQHSVSISTAVQALRVLENQRLIEARPRSGFFVARQPSELPEPAPSRPPATARYVGTPPLLREYIETLATPQMMRLGAVVPEPSMFPAKRITRSLAAIARRNPELAVTYDVYSSGADGLRRAIARRALDCGVRISADDIVVTGGCIEAVSLALRAVARPGDTIALESPTYFPLLQTIAGLGMKVLEIPTHPRTGISVDALDLATQKPGAVRAVLVMGTYSNPLGSSMPDEAKRKLVELCAAREIPIIEDDVHGEITFEESRPRPLKAWDKAGSVLLCSSFSKTVAPGLRIGWIVPGCQQREIELLKLSATLFTSQLAQLALAEFVAGGGYDHHLRRLRHKLQKESLRMRDAVGACFPDGSRITRPAGGYVMWVELPPRTDAVELFRRARVAGIAIAPGPLFSSTNRFGNCIRLSFSHSWTRDVEDAIATVGRLARELRPGNG